MSLRIILAAALCIAAIAGRANAQDSTLARQSEIRRTAHGVPHIRAENFKAAGYALGWVQLEDYGKVIPIALRRTRGDMAVSFGHDSIEADFINRRTWQDAAAGFPLLDQDTRDMYIGFAAAVNAYIRTHRAEIPDWIAPDFSPVDALATDIEVPSSRDAERLVQRVAVNSASREGSNAWALAPSRTKSGKAILLRNPHLNWDAGYYEAQLTVPGKLDFYGDFRIGGPFQTIGGFNARLGWSTTNNAVDPDEVYVLTLDPGNERNVLLDGASIPLRHEAVSMPYRSGDTLAFETRDFVTSPIGRVLRIANGKAYVWKYAGEHRANLGQMWLRMMRAQNLNEWKAAMRMLAKPSSNFTYADADGNIFYVWYGQVPRLPHAPGGDTTAIEVTSSSQVWTSMIPFDSLPQLLNPKGGYIHQENDPFHYTNLNEVFSADRFPPNLPQPELGLRSQLAISLIGGKDKLSLEDVIARKFSMRMLLAERFKPDLLAALKNAQLDADAQAGVQVLENWDNTVAPESKGSVLFELWWNRYMRTAGGRADSLLAKNVWTPKAPTTTPSGLASTERAVESFKWVVAEMKQKFGALDPAWGDLHRVRIDNVDLPVGGCTGAEGCFRVLWYRPAEDGKLVAYGGDGWIMAIEFGKVPRAYSVLAYGDTNRPGDPNHSSQLEMFATGKMKPVLFTPADIEKGTVKRYNPGF